MGGGCPEYYEGFCLSEKICDTMTGDMIYTKDVKEFIKEGDKIFISKPYGDDKVTNEMYDYAVKKWEAFKKLAGKELVCTDNTYSEDGE